MIVIENHVDGLGAIAEIEGMFGGDGFHICQYFNIIFVLNIVVVLVRIKGV